MGLHQPYSLITSAGNMPDLDHKIKRANEQFHEWHVYWDGYYGMRCFTDVYDPIVNKLTCSPSWLPGRCNV